MDNNTKEGPRAPFNQSAFHQPNAKERFYRYFQEEVTELQEQISQLGSHALAGGERQDAIDNCIARISRLSNEVTDATDFIPAYDQRTYSQAIQALKEKLDETRAKFAPKSRFKFKTTNKNNSAISLSDAAELAKQQRLQHPALRPGFSSSTESSMATTPANPSEVETRDTSSVKNYNSKITAGGSGSTRTPSFSRATDINISGHTGLHIILPVSASRATSSGSLTKLNRCIVDTSVPTADGAPFAGLALKDIKNSLIIVGHVAGAAHITAVQDSIIVVASRQVRMHDCNNVDIYLHCSSRPIIEDCRNVRFAPIPACHAIASQEPVQNQWDQVDDFKWLKAEPSPNWSILPEGQRLQEDIWTNVVPGGPGVGPDDILERVGIVKQ